MLAGFITFHADRIGYMKRLALAVLLAATVLIGCQANQSSFSPDITSTIRPQSSDAVNVNDDDVRVTIRNQGEINAFDINVDITADGTEVRDETLSQLASQDEEVIRFEAGETLTEYCSDETTTLEVTASPSVKDLDPSNNEASQAFTC